MMKSLPLGIDIGAIRMRVVWSVLTASGPRIRAVATRDLSAGVASSGTITDSSYIGALLDEGCDELQTRERRCVISVGEPDAVLRTVAFPKMTEVERRCAVVFEAQRHVDYAIEEGLVRIHPVDEKRSIYAVGVARKAVIRSRLEALKSGGLRVVGVDHESLALARALPGYDAILDIGHEYTRAHIMLPGAPVTLQCVAGGATITRGIERELSIDGISAERRKRILGTVGAGERARSYFLAEVASLLESASVHTNQLKRIALVGNGARLNNLAFDLERATGLLIETPVSRVLLGDAYPADVIKAGAPDWNLAAGLSTWGAAA